MLKKNEKKVDLKNIEKFLMANPAVMCATLGLLALKYLMSESGRPAWLKDCAPIHGRRAGPWRGKGSFGRSFGPNRIKHK